MQRTLPEHSEIIRLTDLFRPTIVLYEQLLSFINTINYQPDISQPEKRGDGSTRSSSSARSEGDQDSAKSRESVLSELKSDVHGMESVSESGGRGEQKESIDREVEGAPAAGPTYTLGDFFTIMRGVETGDNGFFILSPRQIIAFDLPEAFLRPILPHPGLLPDQEIVADPEGHPILERRLYLLDCSLPENEIERDFPGLWHYLETGKERGVDQRYSCRHRSPWYSQERRPPAPFLCAYTGRNQEGADREETPFRFILNHSIAVAPNIYLMMYPRPALSAQIGGDYRTQINVWDRLNRIGREDVLSREVVYHDVEGKMEPNELASVPASQITELFPELVPDSAAQLGLFDQSHP